MAIGTNARARDGATTARVKGAAITMSYNKIFNPKKISSLREFEKFLSRYDLRLEKVKTHYAIRNSKNCRVGTISATPRCPMQYAIENTIKQLRANGCLKR